MARRFYVSNPTALGVTVNVPLGAMVATPLAPVVTVGTAAGVTPIKITTAQVLPSTTGGATYSQVIATTGGNPNVTWGWQTYGMPTWLCYTGFNGAQPSLNLPAGNITLGTTGNGHVNEVINPSPLALVQTTLGTATHGTPITPIQLTTTGGVGTVTFGVPASWAMNGLSLSSSGVLSGTPTAAGSIRYRILTHDQASITSNFSMYAYDGTSMGVGLFQVTVSGSNTSNDIFMTVS